MKPALVRLARAALPLAVGLGAGSSPSPGTRDLGHVTPAQRLEHLRRAQVWQSTDVASKDLLAGPPGKDAFKFDEQVACDYFKPPEGLGGSTPKFMCALEPKDIAKVKYGRKNGEVYAAVAASRLYWALGFGADAIYPVQVTCRNCPIEPWWWSTEKRVDEKTYEMATIERRVPGDKIESKPDEGWAWPELDKVDESAGGAPRAHRDALKLLSVLLQNSDTKADNQRMICPPKAIKKDAAGNETCEQPFLYVHDLGYGLGKGTLLDTSKVDVPEWEGAPVWKDRARCIGNLKKSLQGTFGDPPISEAGRKFLADLLVQLTDKQIADMFTAARVDRYHEHPERNVPVSEWVRVFKKKRDEIVNTRCPGI